MHGKLASVRPVVSRVHDLSPLTPVQGCVVRSVSLSGVMMTFMEFEKGTSIPEHRHPHEQITYLVSGRMELWIEGVTHVLRAGDVAAIPSNVPHRALCTERCVAIDSWNPIREDYRPKDPT